MPCNAWGEDLHPEKQEITRLMGVVNGLTEMLCRMCHAVDKESLPQDIGEWFAVHLAWDEIREKRGMDASKHNHGDV